jgi:copper chaperone CopZ
MSTTPIRTLLRSDELSCPSCVPKIEKALLALPGVTTVEVKFSSGRIEIEHDPPQSDEAALVETKVGYAARPAAL